MDGANMSDTELAGSYLAGGSFAGADLSKAVFSSLGGETAVFTDTYQTKDGPVGLSANLNGANMIGADLRGNLLSSINLQNANLSGADFRFSKLRNANLSGANLREANLSNADLREAVLAYTDMQGADLSGALLSGVDAFSAKLSGVKLSGTDLSFADLTGADLEGATLFNSYPSEPFKELNTYQGFYDLLNSYGCRDGVFLVKKGDSIIPSPVNFMQDSGVRFYASKDFKDAVIYLCGANLTGAKLQSLPAARYDLAGVNLSQADVSSSDLSQAIFNDVLSEPGWEYPLTVNLEGIVYNGLTEWPSDFTPPPPVVPFLKTYESTPGLEPEKSE
jgi:uncharacterized protein YjbI with pentapeptide repeats